MDMKQIEALYELSPLQQGLLFHTLYDTGGGMYVEQFNCTLQGNLDIAAFQRAWQHVADRHSVLRTSFHWEELAKPLQMVQRRVDLAWQLEDWRDLAPTEQTARLAAYLAADRARGFDLSTAPLIRLALFRMAVDTYSFIWSHHHILLDGWSVSLVLNEILAAYAAFAHGQQLQLPHPRPYRDYIAWLQRQNLVQAEAFWRRSLAGFGAPTPLGIERPNGPAVGGAERYAERRLRVPVAATSALQDFARRQGLTLNTLVSGAWALLLSRYSGAEDVLFGATVAGRPPDLAGVETMVGLFINTLPVRVYVDAALGACAWLQQLQALQLDLRKYEYSPLVQVQGWSDISRGLSMFESLLVFENYPADSAVQEQGDRPRLAVRDVRAVEQTNYPITVVAAPGQALMLQISYECARFDAATVARMLGHMRALLEQLAARPDQPLAEVSLLTMSERQQLLVEWNDTATGVRGRVSGIRNAATDDTCLHQLFEAQATRAPDALAVAFDATNDEGRTTNDESELSSFVVRPSSAVQLTYAELNRRANQLAQHLRALGVGPEVRVGLCAERSIAALVGILAILKAGGVFVPLDPAYPAARLEYMLLDSETRLLLVHAATLNGALAIAVACPLRAIVCLDCAPRPPELPADVAFSDAAAFAERPGEPCAPINRAEDTVYVMYTSGSTGQPKGVPIRHGNAVPFFQWYQGYFGFRPDDRIIQYHSLSFDFSTWEVFEALHAGACLQMVSMAVARDVGALADQLSGARITVLNMTPSQFGVLSVYAQQFRPAALRTVRILVLGGEILPPALAQRAAALAPLGCRLHNEYGPTETTISSSIFRIGAGALERYAGMPSMPVGRPIGNTQLHVLDAGLRLVPIGLPGELYIGGVGLARGYLNRPDLTAERFVPNPFAKVSGVGYRVSEDAAPNTRHPIPATRLYRTGDLARYLSDGGIEILGRRDQQVKLRGYRVELGEIETVMAQHPALREVAVVVREDAPGDQRLVAYIVPTNDERRTTSDEDRRLKIEDSSVGASASLSSILYPLSSDLRSFLATRLPEYMMPSAFVPLAALPLTPNGKLDRKALPAPESARPAAVETFAAPRTAIEELLAEIWADVLRLDQVVVHDNFFVLGGHSLLATQVISRVRAAFAVELPLRSLFEAPTVAGLAQRIAAARHDAPDGAGLPLRPVAHGAVVPISFAQQRLWFLDQLRPGSTAYNLPTAVRLIGSLDVPALWRSMHAIIGRHEALRTTFDQIDGQPMQVIALARPPRLPLLDLRALGPELRQKLVRRLATDDAQRPFDLVRGPLLRAHLLRLAEREHVALLNMHHIVSDGWSVGIFIQELATLYAAYTIGQATALPELPIQYADYTLWQREWLRADVLERQLSYWKRSLADLPVLQLPTDHPRPAVGTYQGLTMSFLFPRALVQELTALNRQASVTSFMTLLATFQALLARWSGQDDIVVGTPIAGRTHAEIEPLIGFFANTLVLRTRMAGRPSFQDVLQRVREVCLNAYAHQELPFEQIVEALAPVRDLSYTPLFQVMFALQNAPATALELPNLKLQTIGVERRTTQFDLNLALIETERGLISEIQYSTDLFDASTIVRLQRHFQTLLAGAVADPERSIWALPLLSAAEQQQMLIEWNDTRSGDREHGTGDRRERCVHKLFEDQAARVPDAIALVFDPTKDEGRRTNDDPIRIRGLGGKDQDGAVSAPDPRPPTPEPWHLTYAELNRRANQLAHHLHSLNVRPGMRVGLCLPRSLDLVIGVFGILKAGAAYIPIDPAYPAARISLMLEHSGAGALIMTKDERPTTNDELSGTETRRQGDKEADVASNLTLSPSHLVTLSRRTVDLRADRPLISRQPDDAPTSGVSADHLMYVIYTSGSTGAPKGAGVYHRGFANLVRWFAGEFAIAARDHVLLMTSFSFDLTQKNLFAPLAVGATVHLAPAGHFDARPLCDLIATRRITLLNCTPSALYPLVDHAALCGHAQLISLRAVFLGGEPIAVARLIGWLRLERCRAQVVNSYGPTECTDVVAYYRLAEPERLLEAPVPIGRPISNTRLLILDADQRPAPAGTIGELYVAGIGVGSGYLNDAALTAERFVPNPFARVSGVGYQVLGIESSDTRYPTPDTRLYKTGDLARHLADGKIVFLGRIDDQVKLRGFRIELGEVEAELHAHPAVRECALVVRKDASGEPRLVAYVVPTREQGTGDREQEEAERGTASLSPVTSHLSPSELRDFLGARLPDYMLPSAFVMVDALPRTPSGKLDRRALPAPDHTAQTAEPYVAPRTPMEDLLAELWAEVLGVAQVSAEDNFFDLGGHSLLATQVIARVRETCAVELPLRALFETPTVAALAPQIAAAQHAVAGLMYSELRPVPRGAPLPLSFAQQRLWFLEQLAPGSAIANMPLAVRLSGSLDPAALRAALGGLVQRHEVLRTRFPIIGEQPMQQIDPPALPYAGARATPLPLIDLQALPTEMRERASQRLANAEAHAPFDLACGPLLRAALLRLAPDTHALLLTMHHIVSDGWSMGILVRDLTQLYIARTTSRPAALPELPIQYADYALWQRRWLHGEGDHAPAPLQTQLAYWKAHLAGPGGQGGPPILTLPTDHTRPAVPSQRGAQQGLRLDAELQAGLRALSRRTGATLFMMLLAAWQTLLAQRSGQTDIVVGTDVAGRTQRETEELIGCFVNQLVLRTSLAGNPSFTEVLRRVRAVCLAAYTHQDVPFDQVVAALGGARHSNRTPLFQVKIILQPASAPVEQPGLTLQLLPIEQTTSQFDLTLSLYEAARNIDAVLDYSTDLFEAATIRRLLEHYELLLRTVVAQPEARLDDVTAILARAGRQQQIEEGVKYRDRRLERLNKLKRKVSTE